ncbi:hypothetical protein MMC34_007525 [Xylographa carneopallida]|nr:hypothetical protein [Xylographa carneopallida]
MDYDQKIERWEKEGLMTPEQIMQRLDDKIETYGFYDERATVQKNFDSACTETNGVKHLDEAGFVKFLAQAFPPSFDLFIETGPVLYTSVVYLAQFPFMTAEPSLLTFRALVRALALMLPTTAHCWGGGESSNGTSGEHLISRERSDIDRIRLLFQSFADEYEDSGPAGDEIQEVTEPRNQHTRVLDFQAPNSDPDGDEMYHDVLDVLSATRPGMEYDIPCPRDSFRPLATKLWQTDVRLSHYCISRERLASLVKLLLLMHPYEAGNAGIAYSGNADDLDATTANVVNTFSDHDSGSITWPVFYNRMTATAPLLLAPLEGLLNLFLQTSAPVPRSAEAALPPGAQILSVPILRQLSLVLANTIAFDGLKLLYHCTLAGSSDPEGFATLVDVLQRYRVPCFLLIRGQSDADRTVTYGAFLPVPGQQLSDACSRHAVVGSFLFQLLPRHDVFAARADQPSWSSSGREIWFGDWDAGVAFRLADGLKQGVVVHRLTGDGAYKGNVSRGEWETKVRVNELEVWMQRD